MSRRYTRYLAFVAAFAVILVLDRLTKHLAEGALGDGTVVTLLPGILDLKLVHNAGAAFGIGQGHALLFVAAAVVILGVCAVYLVRSKPPLPLCASLGAVAGGGVGNLVDRLSGGSVTDFLMTTFIDFPVFNVADIAIVCGFVVTFFLLWLYDDERPGGGGEEGRAAHD